MLSWEEAWDAAASRPKRYVEGEIEAFLGEWVDDYDLEGLINACTYIDPRTGARMWEPRFLEDDEAFTNIIDRYDKTLQDEDDEDLAPRPEDRIDDEDLAEWEIMREGYYEPGKIIIDPMFWGDDND